MLNYLQHLKESLMIVAKYGGILSTVQLSIRIFVLL